MIRTPIFSLTRASIGLLAMVAACFCLSASRAQAQFSFKVTQDTFASNDDNSGPTVTHGTGSTVEVRHNVAPRSRIGFFRIDVPTTFTRNVQNAQLQLWGITNSETSSGHQMTVYGILDGPDQFTEGPLTWNTAPGLIPSTGNATPSAGFIVLDAETTPAVLDFTKITTLTTITTAGNAAFCQSVPNAAFDAFVNSDTNNTISFLVMRPTSGDGILAGTHEGNQTSSQVGSLIGTFGAPLPTPTPTPTPTPHPTLHLQAHWKLDDGAGTTATEEINPINGTLFNFDTATCWVDHIHSETTGSLKFDGINDYITAPTSPAINFTTESFSVSFLMQQSGTYAGDTTTHTECRYFSKGLYVNNTFKGRYEATDKAGNFTFTVDDGSTATGAKSDCTIADARFVTNNWVHVVCVRNAETHQLQIFRDDNLVATVTDTSKSIADNTGPIAFGASVAADKPATIGFFKGEMDDIQIYRDALNQADIAGIEQNYTAINATKRWSVYN